MAKLTDTPKVKKEIRRPLRPKDIAFVKAKAKNPTIPNYKVAMMVTNATTPNSANVEAQRMLQNATLREALDAALQRQGFTIDHGAQALVEALQAKKTYQSEGQLMESDVADHSVRMGAARAIFSFLEDKSDDKANTTVNFNFGSQTYVKH